MTTPFFLDSVQVPFNYLEHAALTDVETGGVGIITDLRLQLVTNLGWSEPSTALFKAPVDAAGRFLDVLLTRISATVIEWRVRNQNGTTICTRRAQIVSGNNVRYFCSTQGVVVECLTANQGSSETLKAHILDQSPDAQSDSSNYVIGAGRRDNASTDDGGGNIVGHYFALDNGSAAHVAGRVPQNQSGDGAVYGTVVHQMLTQAGSLFFRDVLIQMNQAGVQKWSGRVCHALICNITVAYGSRRTIYVDTATTGLFQVLGCPAVDTNQLMMMRVA